MQTVIILHDAIQGKHLDLLCMLADYAGYIFFVLLCVVLHLTPTAGSVSP